MFVRPVGRASLHMETRIENIAATNATLKTVSEVLDMKMTAEEYGRETAYQSSMFLVRQMLQQGIIDEGDFEQAEKVLREKFNPITSYLLSCNDLICARSRALIDTTQEKRG